MNKELGLISLIAVAALWLLITVITGCADPYQDCIEREKTEYRTRNPKASYGEVQNRYRDFELMCSKFKK